MPSDDRDRDPIGTTLAGAHITMVRNHMIMLRRGLPVDHASQGRRKSF